jgi:hypothetical protein
MADKTAAVLGGGDPVENLRRGWDAHIGFGVANPAYYAVMFGPGGDGQIAASAAHGLTSLRIAWPDAPWHEDVSTTLREAMIAAVVTPAPVTPIGGGNMEETP